MDGEGLVRRYLDDVFTRGNIDRMPEYLRGATFMDGVSALVRRWRNAFPDFAIEVEEAITTGDRVVTVEAMTGTHLGIFESRLGPIAPTGRRVRWSRISIRRLDGDRFVDGFFEEDEIGLLDQLGVLEAGSAAAARGRHSPLAASRPTDDPGTTI